MDKNNTKHTKQSNTYQPEPPQGDIARGPGLLNIHKYGFILMEACWLY